MLRLRVYAQHAEADVFHIRTKGGRHEIDFILEHPNGILAIKTKLTPTVTNNDLRWLQQTL